MFEKAFTLGDLDEVLPPGSYQVETDEELIGDLSFRAYRRIMTVIHLRPNPGKPGLARTLTVDPAELDAALTRDAMASQHALVPKPFKGMSDKRRAEIDARVIEQTDGGEKAARLHPF